MTAPKLLPVESVEYDPAYFPRSAIDLDCTVARYTERLLVDESFDFPPVVAVKGGGATWVVLDGVHRLLAYQRAEREQIPAIVEVLPQSKWFVRSVELNLAHGKPLGIEDRTKIVQRMEVDGWEIDKIAALLKVRVDTIRPYSTDGGRIKPITAHPKASSRREGTHRGQGQPRTPAPRQTKASSEDTPRILIALDEAIQWLAPSGRVFSDPDILSRLERLQDLVEAALRRSREEADDD